MKRNHIWPFVFGCLTLFALGARALSGAPKASEPAPTSLRVDSTEALRRARLEQSLIRAEKTAILLGELAAVREPSE